MTQAYFDDCIRGFNSENPVIRCHRIAHYWSQHKKLVKWQNIFSHNCCWPQLVFSMLCYPALRTITGCNDAIQSHKASLQICLNLVGYLILQFGVPFHYRVHNTMYLSCWANKKINIFKQHISISLLCIWGIKLNFSDLDIASIAMFIKNMDVQRCNIRYWTSWLQLL